MHQVITKDFPENMTDGVMLCGINFGYSQADEAKEMDAPNATTEPRSFFSDMSVNKTRFKERTLKWLNSFGLELTTQPASAGSRERLFFQTNWLDTQTRSVSSNERITVSSLVRDANGVVGLMERRKPKVIVFFGSTLIEAFNDIALRDRLVSLFGQRSGSAEVLTWDAYSGRKFRVMTQSYGDTQLIGLPHPQARGLSDDFVAYFKPQILAAFRRAYPSIF